MSLINEALKRAEQDKRGGQLPAIDPETLTGMSSYRETPRDGRPTHLAVTAGLIVVALAWCCWRLASDFTGVPSPAEAYMAVKAMVPTSDPASAAAGEVNVPDVTDAAQAIRQETAASLARVLNERKNGPPSQSPGEIRLVPSGPTPQAVLAAVRAAQAEEQSRVEAPPPPAVMRPDPLTRINPAQFKLSGVMNGPDGATAIINGSYYMVGQMIGPAKVVHIDNTAVELECDGQRFTIRM